MRKTSALLLIIFLLLIFYLFSSCKVVKHSDLQKKSNGEEVTFYFENEGFDASVYVKENWESRVIPEIKENADELSIILEGLKDDFDSTANTYGIRKEDTSPFSFAVKGNIKIKEIDRESSVGTISIDIPDLTGTGLCRIQIGPIIKKSMVRDYLTFIQFGDFENQIEYANVSRELNFYVRDNVVNSVDGNYKPGMQITFEGVFTYDKSGAVLITPVEISIGGGSEQ